MAISTIGQNGLTVPLTSNTITSASATALTLQSAGTTAVTIDTSQNVGIGTTSPAANLDVQATTGPQVRIKPVTGTSYGYLSLSNTGGNFNIGRESSTGGSLLTGSSAYASVLNSFGAYPMQFGTNGSLAMTIDSSQNLLVGTTSTSGLQTATAGGLATDGKNYLWVTRSGGGGSTVDIGRTSSAGTGNYVEWWYNGTNTGTVSTNGSTTSYNTSSDYRLKENIQPMTGALATVSQLKPVTYKWKADGSDGQGFIAHELQAVVPDCVTGEKDAVDDDGNPKYQAVDTSFLVATLTAAIQELKAINDQQAETINALTARIEALENK